MRYSKEWIDFIEQIEEAKVELDFRENEENFFRGHTNNAHTLLPGLFRKASNTCNSIQLWEKESDMFYEFRARAKEVHNGNLTDWDILFYMQHHSAKTRLLDWTESFGVAVYFSLLNYSAENSSSSPTI